jgi:phage-related protein
MEVQQYRTGAGNEPAREYIDSLPYLDRVNIAADIETIIQNGIEDPKLTTRKLKGGKFKGKLWELKTGSGNQQRIFYCVVKGPILIMLHACKKQKEGGQKKDLDVAAKRMKDVL